MKKIFIGLLIVAAGAAIFFLLKKTNKPVITSHIQQQQIIGKWKLDSLMLPNDSTSDFLVDIMGLVDPHLKKYEYEFTKDGAISLSLDDSLTKDSLRYVWNDKGQLLWKEYPIDTVGTVFDIPTLNQDSLLLRSDDSTTLVFKRIK
jgi:hypothetical protein